MCSFNRVIARLLNLKVEVEGSLDLPAQQGYLIASNHLGYIDGIVLAGLFPIIFVTKSEVRRWPLIGQWTALVGTICVERNRKNKIPIFVDETADKLKLGVNEIHSKLETAAYKNNSANRKQVSRTCRAIIAGEKAAANKMGGGGPVAHGMARGGR
jgi:1-acyl-sn-glycerol-3-phosphate acyltransferase